MLNQESSIPLYLQLKNLIKDQIDDNILLVGDKIQSENELSLKYNVSRITVRKSLSELVKDGYLIKKQGKGTFVSKPKVNRPMKHMMGFSASCKANGLSSTSIISHKEIIHADDELREILNLNDGERVLYIQRVRYAGNDPIMIENNYYPYTRYRFLLEEDLTCSLYKLLKSKLGIKYFKSKKTIVSVTKCNHEHSNLLKISVGEPLFVMDKITVDQDDNVVYSGKDFIIGERYCFDMSGNIETLDNVE